jgi:hypothetical protein
MSASSLNLGSQQIANILTGGMGFSASPAEPTLDLDYKIYTTGVRAAKRKFLRESMNRNDKVIVFRP